MTTAQLDRFFREMLNLDAFTDADPSLNGLQVDNDGAEIRSIAFAVDAGLETFRRAAAADAGMLFVHHGLFWGRQLRLAGGHRERIRFLLDHNIALYAVHLPLDQHPALGNNAALAELLGLKALKPFGLWNGVKIGWLGTFPAPVVTDEAARRISFNGRQPLAVFPFGRAENTTCAVVSGGAAQEVLEAIDAGADLYVTGEASHAVYHQIAEAGINMIAGGHYATEVWGVRRVMAQCAAVLEAGLEFIDVPTGL
ncbi:MAG: Nif3-like dinuclear metal center hexameric protein [Spirochaetaceae bacterium]|jgi:dinuclear metal center YbgI/SA1388 family protein|nr:Nif3-like dinuclear metal center hexameric protein [Spirochaetaceae bacterium]